MRATPLQDLHVFLPRTLDAGADTSRSMDATGMQPGASDAPLSLLSANQVLASQTMPGDNDRLRNAHVAHVRYVEGDDHLLLQLSICNDHKQFFRSATEKLDKLRHRLQILAAQAVAGATQPFLGNRTRKQRNKLDQLHAQSTAVRVRFVTTGNEEIVGKSVTVADALMRTQRLTIGDQVYVVLRNQPRVLRLSVVRPVLAGMPLVPLAETEFCDPNACSWCWYRVDADGKATLLGETRRSVPTADDLGYCFRITCRAPIVHSQFAEESTAQFMTTPVVRGPDRSAFEERRRLGATRARGPNAFRVMTYNVLFEGYTTSHQAKTELFPYAKHEVMEEMYRMQLVFQEIDESNADIVCLQEMGQNAFQTFFEPMMTPLGYHTCYTGKTGTTQEGCAVLVRKDRFEVVEERALAVSTEALQCEDAGVIALLKAFPELGKGLAKIPSIAQLLVLRDRYKPFRYVLLANTHLFYREDADIIRLVQAIATVRAIERLQAELTAKGHHAAVVFCGDFNAVPDSSAVGFLLDGGVDHSHRHWQELKDFRWARNGSSGSSRTSSPRAVASQQTDEVKCIAHSLALTSACGIPDFTNFAGSFVATLDYILLGSRELEVTQPFPLFTRAQVSAEVALPSTTFPSDHISLIADLQWHENE